MLTWKKREAWIGVFDILGFRSLIREADKDFPRSMLTSDLGELLERLDSEQARQGSLQSIVFSDTIVIFTPSKDLSDYPWFLLQCKNLMRESIRIRLPLRGAIATGA